MESVRELVFFSPRRPPKMHDWSSAFFPARKVGAYAVTLHLGSVCSRYRGSPRCSGRPVPGKHDLIVSFLKGARRMNPSRSPLVPSWDLSIVLVEFQRGPFEPLDSVELKFLSLKTPLLTALTSIKRVGDLQAFSVKRRVPCVWAGLLSRCLETPAWIRA